MYFTEKQLRIMEFIQQFREERGISPTLEEIASNFGVTKITIYEHINQLERKGALKREKFRARSIELLVPVRERNSRLSLPLMGNLRAGAPIEAPEQREDFHLTDVFPVGKNCFALKVRGNSMISDHIADGDIVIVEKREDASEGDTVVAVLESGEALIRRYSSGEEPSPRVSTNGAPQKGSGRKLGIRGVVVSVVRKY
jgi:repressor LexA